QVASRTQVIYLQSEIGAARGIDAIALDVATPPGSVLNRWTIRMKHTSYSGYHPFWETNGWLTVFQTNQSITSTGWVTFRFDQPFDYNGTDNLMVDFSFWNVQPGSSQIGYARSTATSEARSITWIDNIYGDPLNWA